MDGESNISPRMKRFQRGLTYLRGDQIDLARDEFKESLKQDPNDAPARFGMGCVYALQGLRDNAVEEWIRCIQIDPHFAEAHYALAWAYYDALDPQKGYEHVKRAMATGVKLDSIKDLVDRFVRTGQPRYIESRVDDSETPDRVEDTLVRKILTRSREGFHGNHVMPKRRWGFTWDRLFLLDLLVFFFIFFLCLYLLNDTLQTGYPRDHLDATIAFYIAKIKMLIRNRSLYTESWYFGYEMLKYYPPLSTYLPAFFAMITGNLMLSYYYLCFFFYTAFCVGVYMFVSRIFESRTAGLFSGALWVFTHINFISFQGHYWETCRLMGTSAVPWALYFIHRTLREWRKRDLIVSIALSAYCMLSNLFSAIDLVLLAAPYLILSQFSSRAVQGDDNKPKKDRGWFVLISLSLGVSACSLWWYIPAVLPHGLGALTTGGSDWTPPLMETFLQLSPPSYMPAVHLPLTILGLLGVVVGLVRHSKEGLLMAGWFGASSIVAYIVRIQSPRVVLILGLCMVFGAGYFMKWIQELLTRRSVGYNIWIVQLIVVLLPLGFLGSMYLPGYRSFSVVDESYLLSDEYIASTWLADNTGPEFRVYLMWGDWFRGSQWVSAFYPEVKQVLGGYDQGARAETYDPFIFDNMVKLGEDAYKLYNMALEYHVKYIVIDERFMETQEFGYEKFGESSLFKPLEDLNSRLRYASAYEVLGVTGMETEPQETHTGYQYWTYWRYIGLAASLILTIFSVVFIHRVRLM